MTKTYKDEPLWVKTRNETFHVRWVHREWNIGRVKYKTVIVHDKYGKVVYEPYTYTSYTDYDIWKNGVVERRYRTELVVAYRIKREQIISGSYKNHCTCGMEEEDKRGDNFNLNPCYKVLTKAVQPNYYASTSPREHEGSTRNTRHTLRQMRKAYNVHGEDVLDEDEYSNIYAFKTPLQYDH